VIADGSVVRTEEGAGDAKDCLGLVLLPQGTEERQDTQQKGVRALCGSEAKQRGMSHIYQGCAPARGD
jgi:hypothetical protein